jgi:TetR/AcrR family transcriptional regulator, copper-responsive repressor
MSRGRPRQFDPTVALEQALAVFVRDGFERASVQQLADGMAICKPSLYAAYGNKEALFIEALRLYARRGAEMRRQLLEHEPDGRRAVEALLRHTVEHVTSGEAAGCLLIGEAASTQAGYSPEVREALVRALAQGNEDIHARLGRAQREGQLAADADLDALTNYFGALMAGFAVQARNGASAAELDAVVGSAMHVWKSAGHS